MDNSQALHTLIQKLAIIGYNLEDYRIEKNRDDLMIRFNNLPNGQVVEILIFEFWQTPSISSYFVNYNGNNGDLCYCAGTPHVEQALFNLGFVMSKMTMVTGEEE